MLSCFMNGPFTYSDHLRDDNLAEVFLKMIGASCTTLLYSVLKCLSRSAASVQLGSWRRPRAAE